MQAGLENSLCNCVQPRSQRTTTCKCKTDQRPTNKAYTSRKTHSFGNLVTVIRDAQPCVPSLYLLLATQQHQAASALPPFERSGKGSSFLQWLGRVHCRNWPAPPIVSPLPGTQIRSQVFVPCAFPASATSRTHFCVPPNKYSSCAALPEWSTRLAGAHPKMQRP